MLTRANPHKRKEKKKKIGVKKRKKHRPHGSWEQAYVEVQKSKMNSIR